MSEAGPMTVRSSAVVPARPRSCLAASAALLSLLAGRRAWAGQDPPAGPEIPLAIVVATDHGRSVVDEAWIHAQIAEANRLFAVVPVRFRRVSLAPQSWLTAHVVTRQDRDQAVSRLDRGAVNLRVAASLMDVDQPGLVRRGVHWHLRADRRRHCIILSSISAPQVLAHELGHFFGNGHSQVSDNLMSYSRTGGALFLDDAQLSRVRSALGDYLRSRELVPLRITSRREPDRRKE